MNSFPIAIEKIMTAKTLEDLHLLGDWIRKQHHVGEIGMGNFLTLGGKLADREEENRPPTASKDGLCEYIQFDGFADLGHGDPVMRTDEEGDCCLTSDATISRIGYVGDVRIQILKDMSRETALRLVRKLLAWIEEQPGSFGEPSPRSEAEEILF